VTLVEEGFAQPPPLKPLSGPRQLPADTGLFTGRESELRLLYALAEQARAGGEPGTVVISAIDGMGGVGKTALAIRAAHRLAPRFPDGQLFLDLHGFAPGHEPREPADALASLLVGLGVPAEDIPAHVDERAAVYRDRLAGTRTLVVLDNALDEAQVRPLLPGAENCLVLITSRRRLKALDDALPVPLDVLEPEAAIELLRRTARLGEQIEPDDRALLRRVAELCGYLPLTLVIVGALIRAGGRSWSLRQVAAQLEEEQPEGRELDRYTDGGRNVSAVFDLSYRRLPARHRQFFRRLGLVPGPEIDSNAAASLHSTDPRTATRLLDSLRDQNLVTEVGPGRYRMHDLIRAYTREITARDTAADREQARDRLFEYYESGEGLEWLRSERENLEAAFEYAVSHRLDRHTAALSEGLTGVLASDGPWPAEVTARRCAVDATTRIGSLPEQAKALASLGASHTRIGDYAGAAEALTAALRLYRALGDQARQARVLMNLGHNRWMTGDYTGAERDHAEALPLFEAVGDRAGQARILTERGEIRRMTGDLADAERDQSAAAEIYRELGQARGRARTLNMLGEVRYLRGEYAAAARDLREALEIYRGRGDRFGEANALTYLADVRAATGDQPGASRDVDRAVEVFHDLGSRSNEAWALGHQASIVARAGDHARALPLFRRALALSREVTQPDDEALALEGIGECLAVDGRIDEAVAQLADALEIFRRLGMRLEIERVTGRLAELRPPGPEI
jgi:tetratricopeptide (TPR) repeat protein